MKKASGVVLAVVLFACIPTWVSAQQAKPKKSANEISLAELADPAISGLTLLDAVQKLRPNWMRSRGRTSFGGAQGATMPAGGSCGARGQSTNCSAISPSPGADAPGVILNEVKQDFETLRSIRAGDVTSLRFLSAGDATTLYGTGFEQGAIEVMTKPVK